MSTSKTSVSNARFSIGEIVHHRLFNYRGVVVDVDAHFQSSDAWYEAMAKSRPPKDKPWYHVLVHGTTHTTYVAEQNLQLDKHNDAIDHPLLSQFFSRMEKGRYVNDDKPN